MEGEDEVRKFESKGCVVPEGGRAIFVMIRKSIFSRFF